MKPFAPIAAATLTIFSVLPSWAGSGGMDVAVGYTSVDQVGNLAIDQSTYNIYEDASLSITGLHYRFDNGLQLRSELKNINLKNHNLELSVNRYCLFQATFSANRFRRIYDFRGTHSTRRQQAAFDLSVQPSRYLNLFTQFSRVSLAGTMDPLYDQGLVTIPSTADYRRDNYVFGGRISHDGRLLQFQYGFGDHQDNKNPRRDQSRRTISLSAAIGFPYLPSLRLSGTYHYLATEYKHNPTDSVTTTDDKFGIRSTTLKGGAWLGLFGNYAINYVVVFNRAGSDNDLVDTDNILQGIYLAYNHPRRGGLTIGYQNNINDDLNTEVKANSYFASGWLLPLEKFDVRATYGQNLEKLTEGTRLLGDETRDRFRLVLKYRFTNSDFVSAQAESKRRRNDDINTRFDTQSIALSGQTEPVRSLRLSGGYTYSTGKYENTQGRFAFSYHLINVDAALADYRGLSLGAGATYYRSQRDTDVESSVLRFSGGYRFGGGLQAQATYSCHNFDDFLFIDHYYTANIFEITLSKSLSF